LNWPEYKDPEETVFNEIPGHFRIALGGQFSFVDTTTNMAVTGPVIPGLLKMLCLLTIRVDAGAAFRLQLANSSGSMSILIPGDGPLLHRVCVEQYEYDLKDWFAAVEIAGLEKGYVLFQRF
jgi:hypothetical protein